MMRRLLLALALLAAPALAHRGHDSLTVVTLAAGDVVTVSHRFEAADIEPALATIAPQAQVSLDDPDAIKALQAYLARRFTISDATGPIAFTPGRVDIDAQEVRIAFTGHAHKGTSALTIRSTILDDVYPHQTNQVNVRHGQTVRTLAITDGSPQTVAF